MQEKMGPKTGDYWETAQFFPQKLEMGKGCCWGLKSGFLRKYGMFF